MILYTIGFTQKSAEQFFEALKAAGVRRVVDVRLNNTSQLAGFTKRDDLVYFLRAVGGMNYVHLPELAPDKSLLDLAKNKKGPWDQYEAGFSKLLAERKVDGKYLAEALQNGDCLLCSEPTPERCHRRLIAERLKAFDDQIQIVNL